MSNRGMFHWQSTISTVSIVIKDSSRFQKCIGYELLNLLATGEHEFISRCCTMYWVHEVFEDKVTTS